jgi:hypothetical protein
MMNPAPHVLKLRVIVRGKRLVAPPFQLSYFRFDFALVDSLHFVVLVHVNVERLAERNEQMLFVQLRVPLQRFVLDVGGYVAQLADSLML